MYREARDVSVGTTVTSIRLIQIDSDLLANKGITVYRLSFILTLSFPASHGITLPYFTSLHRLSSPKHPAMPSALKGEDHFPMSMSPSCSTSSSGT